MNFQKTLCVYFRSDHWSKTWVTVQLENFLKDSPKMEIENWDHVRMLKEDKIRSTTTVKSTVD